MSHLIIALALCCTVWPQSSKKSLRVATHGKNWRAEQTDTIREVVLAPILRKWRSGYAVFVRIDGPTPGKGFWNRLLRHNKEIQPGTDAQPLDEKHDAPWDAKTGKSGGIVSIEPLRWKNDEEVEVRAGSVAGLMDADHSTYHLRWEKKRWIIKRLTDSIVS